MSLELKRLRIVLSVAVAVAVAVALAAAAAAVVFFGRKGLHASQGLEESSHKGSSLLSMPLSTLSTHSAELRGIHRKQLGKHLRKTTRKTSGNHQENLRTPLEQP